MFRTIRKNLQSYLLAFFFPSNNQNIRKLWFITVEAHCYAWVYFLNFLILSNKFGIVRSILQLILLFDQRIRLSKRIQRHIKIWQKLFIIYLQGRCHSLKSILLMNIKYKSIILLLEIIHKNIEWFHLEMDYPLTKNY